MASVDVQALIKKALTDGVFRIGLERNFDKTLTDHNIKLDADELKALRAVEWGSVMGKAGMKAASWVHIYKTGAKGIGDISRPGR